MLFLTYHIIANSESKDEGLFTIQSETLLEHFSELKQLGYSSGGMKDLLEGRTNEKHCFVTFDDGTTDHFDVVAPLLEGNGFRGIFFVPTEKIGHAGRLDRYQIEDLAKRGHEIGCHSHEHRRLDILSESAIAEQLARSCDMLGEITGRRPAILAPPGGYTNRKVRRVCAQAGIPALRTMKWGRNKKMDITDLETIALHRDFPTARLRKILNGQGLYGLRALYFGKQLVKWLLPLKIYEHSRSLALRK